MKSVIVSLIFCYVFCVIGVLAADSVVLDVDDSSSGYVVSQGLGYSSSTSVVRSGRNMGTGSHWRGYLMNFDTGSVPAWGVPYKVELNHLMATSQPAASSVTNWRTTFRMGGYGETVDTGDWNLGTVLVQIDWGVDECDSDYPCDAQFDLGSAAVTNLNLSGKTGIGVYDSSLYSFMSNYAYDVGVSGRDTSQLVVYYHEPLNVTDVFILNASAITGASPFLGVCNFTSNYSHQFNQSRGVLYVNGTPQQVEIVRGGINLGFEDDLQSKDGENELGSTGHEFKSGIFNRAVNYTGVAYQGTNYSVVGNFDRLNGTISMWINPEDPEDMLSGVAFSYAHNKTAYFEVGVSAGGGGMYYVYGSVRPGQNERRMSVESASEYEYGSWHHVVVTWKNGSSLRLYVDGVLEGTSAKVLNWSDVNNARDYFTLGNSGENMLYGYPEPFFRYVGLLDEVTLLTHSESADWVEQVYENNVTAYPSMVTYDLSGVGCDSVLVHECQMWTNQTLFSAPVNTSSKTLYCPPDEAVTARGGVYLSSVCDVFDGFWCWDCVRWRWFL